MWIFRNDAYVSVVQDREDADKLWVRGRVKGDVERFLGDHRHGASVHTTPEADYCFRARVDRADVVAALMDSAQAIDYVNFKNSIPQTKLGNARHDAYLRVWHCMMALQRRLRPKSGYYWPGRKQQQLYGE